MIFSFYDTPREVYDQVLAFVCAIKADMVVTWIPEIPELQMMIYFWIEIVDCIDIVIAGSRWLCSS